MGNAFRMIKDYERALANFRKAVRLYKKFGDRVSYSYTLWSLGTTYKMIGNLSKARDNFMRAMRLFKKTKDPRGIIYCRLGLGEIDLLDGDDTAARKHLSASLHASTKYGFAVEKCHAKTLMAYMNSKRGFFRKIDDGCYNKLGLKLSFRGLPLNIP